MQTRGFQRMRSYIRQRFKGMRSYTRQRFKGRRFQRMRSYTTQRFKRRRLHPYNTRLGNRHWNETQGSKHADREEVVAPCLAPPQRMRSYTRQRFKRRRLHPYNARLRNRHWNETKESKHAEREEVVTSCLAPRIEPPINPIEVQGCLSGRIAEDENLMKVLEMCQDNGKFEEHDRLVTKKIRYYEEEKKNRTMVWALKIEKSATDSYQNKWKQARKQLVSVTLSDLIVEYSDVLKARASYLLVAHMRRKKIYRKSKAGLLCLLNRLEDSKRLLHGYNSPEDWAELYQTDGCVRMDYMSQVPLDKRNVEQEKAMDCFRRAIYFSNQDHRERVQMKRQSYVHLKLAMIHLGCPLAPENHLPLNDIKEAKKHVDIVQSRFRDTLPTATKMLLWKTQSYLFYHQGKYKQAKHKAVDAHKCALRHGFNTEVDILKERIDFCQKKLETHDQILSASEKPVRHEAYSTSQSTASAESAARQITSESPLPPDLHGQMFMNLQQMQRNVGNSNTDPLADLEKIASDKGFVISDNEGSGNCMFHALSEQLTLLKRIKISHGELRQSMVQYLRKNPKLPDGTDLFNFTNGYRSWADYLTDMEQDGTWGDHVILYATANRYKTSIHVISGQSNHCDLIIEPDGDVISTNLLVLGHVHEVHYVSLQPKQEKQSNRRTAHKGYRLQQKVTEHPQKQRKEAKLNGKSKKKHSKWMTADKGYKIQQKVMEHRRKQRKEAKLNGKSKITFKEGQLSDRELDELAGKIAAKWKPLGIHLGISQNALDVIAANENDKPKAMLLHWRNTSTCTSCKVLYQALCHERVGLNNVAKEFCLQSESR